MIDLGRTQLLTLGIGIAGAAVAAMLFGIAAGAGFLFGAALSLAGLRSWTTLAGNLGGQTRSVRASAVFLALRYALIGGAIYVIVNVLGITPVAMVLGLLASFAAVLVELLIQSVSSR